MTCYRTACWHTIQTSRPRAAFYYGYATYASAPSGTLLRPQWEKSVWIHRFFEGNAVSNAPIGGPLLVIAGEADQSVPIDGVRAAVKQICAAKPPVTFRSYAGLDHDPTMEKSTPDQLEWIRALCGKGGDVELRRRNRLITELAREDESAIQTPEAVALIS
jgi:pimeloyl-ACP methyl ester carboxylesterase